MSEDRYARLVTAIVEAAPDAAPDEGLCRASVRILDVTSAALVLMSDEEAGVMVVASDTEVGSIEDLQFVLGEGPCLVAFQSGESVLAPDLSAHWSRWPLFVQAASDKGVRAVFALPLRIGAINLGVLYLCRESIGDLTREQLADAFALSEIATWLLLERQSGASPGHLGEGLEAGWAHRAVVHQATGMVSAQLDVSLSEALTRLRSYAFAEQTAIYGVSKEVVGRRLKLPR